MSHPLYKSKNGAILVAELPNVMRLYDTRDPENGKLGDLEAFLYGFGHMLDRYEATLEQFYADGFLEEVDVSGDPTAIQGWLLPYVAELFGVDLLAPDPESRRRELASGIWIAKRRATKTAIDQAAESMVDAPVVVVDGSRRIVRTPTLASGIMSHREITSLWHPKDANILQQELPLENPTTHVTGFDAKRPKRHDGLPIGTPDTKRHMRARAGGLNRPDSDVRPVDGSGEADALSAFFVTDRRGVPCFPDSYEDRSLRTPDMRAPRIGRPRFTYLKKPDALTLFVRPPTGFFHSGIVRRNRNVTIRQGDYVRPQNVSSDVPKENVYFDSFGATANLRGNNDSSDRRHIIKGLKFSGTLLINNNTQVYLEDCAIRKICFTDNYDSRGFHARNCIFDEFVSDNVAPASEEPLVVLEYVTVMAAGRFNMLHASDCLFGGTLEVNGDGSEDMAGCIRYSRVPSAFDRTHIHMYQSSFGPANFQPWPCLPVENEEEDAEEVMQLGERLPLIGEPGWGVLSDVNPPEVRNGAEDGGEVGAYHDSFHLARLDAAIKKAGQYTPAGRQVFGHYDTRLLANLPQ